MKALKFLMLMSVIIAGVYFVFKALNLKCVMLRLPAKYRASSIGIIGGSDGPTSIFVSRKKQK